MIQRTNQTIAFYAFFTASKLGRVCSPAPVVDVYRPDGTTFITGGAVTAIGTSGLYSYAVTGASVTSGGGWSAIFRTTDTTVDLQHVQSLWQVGVGGIDNLDASIASRLPISGYTAPDNAGITAIRTKTDALALDGSGRVSANIVQIAGQTATATTSVAFPGAISSYAGADTAGTTTLLGRVTAARATNLDTIPTIATDSSTAATQATQARSEAFSAKFAAQSAATGVAGLSDQINEVPDNTVFGLMFTSPQSVVPGTWGGDVYAGALAAENASVAAEAAQSISVTVRDRLTAERAANLERLDAAVSSRASQASINALPTPPTPAQVAAAVLDAADGAGAGWTIRDAIRAALAAAVGDMDISGDVQTLRRPDGSVAVAFDLLPAGGPFTSRARRAS